MLADLNSRNWPDAFLLIRLFSVYKMDNDFFKKKVDKKNEDISSIFNIRFSCRLCIGGIRLLWLQIQLQKLASVYKL